MSTEETLANIDAAIEDWEMGPDAAVWRADGSHEHDPAWWTTQDMGDVRAFPRLSDRIEPYPVVEFDWRPIIAAFSEATRQIAEAYERTWRQVTEAFRGQTVTFIAMDEPRHIAVDESNIVVPFEVDGETREAVVNPSLTEDDVARLFDVPEDMLATKPLTPAAEVEIRRPASRWQTPTLDALIETHNSRHSATWTRTRSHRSRETP